LEKNLERWERYRDDEITNLKWIQIKMSDKSEREFVWPRGGTFMVDGTGRSVVLTCNVTEADFKSYADDGVLPPNITIKFEGNSSMKVQRIIMDGEIDITANTTPSINTVIDGSDDNHNNDDNDDDDGC